MNRPIDISTTFAMKAGDTFLLSLLFFTAGLQAADRGFAQTVQPFFKEHCVQCHGPEKEKGSLRVDQLVAELDDHYSLDHFQNIIDELTTGNMPPEDEPQPNAQKVVEVIAVLGRQLELAKQKHSSGGGRPVRRLTRTEFINTVWDQLGVHTDEEGLPDDLLVGSFETNANLLFMTDMHIQAYLKKARDIVSRFIASRSMKPGRHEIPVKFSPDLMNSAFGFVGTDVPSAGYLQIVQEWWVRDPQDRNQIAVGPAVAGIEYDLRGTQESPQQIDFKVYRPNARINWVVKRSPKPSINLSKGLTKQENAKRIKALGRYKLNAETLVKAQQRMSKHPAILGRIRNAQMVSHQPYEFFEAYLKSGDQLPDSAARNIIGKFVALMKRGRPVDPGYIDKLTVVFRHGREMGLPFWEAIVEPMAIAMCSLDAMMHFENRAPGKPTRTIAGVELANRLSFSLWRSAPDSELIRLGRSGALLDEEVRREQVMRMMNDGKFERFLSDFADQWFELPRQDEIAVNPRVYRNFEVAVKPSMKEETVQFFAHLVEEDLSLLNLIDSKFMVLNNAMARHYGIPDVHGPEFRAVPRKGTPQDRVRGGILTHAGILMQGGTGDRTSIVERGAFVARKIINKPPGVPPPDVGELPTDDADTAKMTGVELVNLHASSAQCASCHSKFDPLGMGLENFDAVGLFRNEETRLNPRIDELNRRQRRNPNNFIIKVGLNTKGYLYDGQRFDGLAEMKRALLTKRDHLALGFINALFEFVNGREANIADATIIERIGKQSRTKNFPARSMIIDALSSEMMTTY